MKNRIFILTAVFFSAIAISSGALPTFSASCDFSVFLSCRDTFNLQGCINACPYINSACPAGTPPDTECKVTDPACSDVCWDKGNTHGASCATSAGCTTEQIQVLLQGGTIKDNQDVTSKQPKRPSPSFPKTIPPSLPISLFSEISDDSGIKLDSPDIPKTKALINDAPKKSSKPKVRELKEDELGIIYKVSGEAEILLPDGTIVEIDEKETSEANPLPVPKGAQVFTGDETLMRLKVRSGYMQLDALSELTMDEYNSGRLGSKEESTRMRLKTGKVDVGIAKGEFTSDMKIATPEASASPSGTHFAVAYDKKTGISVFEIYDGTIQVTHDRTGKTVAMTSYYGEPIKRVEVGSDGVFVPKIAIPGNEWEAKKEPSKTVAILAIFAIIALVAVITLFFRRRAVMK